MLNAIKSKTKVEVECYNNCGMGLMPHSEIFVGCQLETRAHRSMSIKWTNEKCFGEFNIGETVDKIWSFL